MEEHRDIHRWTPPSSGTAFALGRFDGMHLGHRALIGRTVAYAREHNLTPVCFSFQEDTYPGARERGQLATTEEKIELLEELGVEVLLHPAFEPPLIDTPAGEFLHSMLIDRWRAAFIAVGFDFRFGKDREGDTSFLKTEAERRGVVVLVLDPVTVDGEVVKATGIRSLIAEGKVERAGSLLDRPYSVTARRIPGGGTGTKLGYPTLNFPWPEGKVMPRYGVYAVRVASDAFRDDSSGRVKPAVDGVTNFGIRPTVEPDRQEPILEAHLLGPGRMIGKIAEPPAPDALFTTEFHAFLRDERRFDSLDALKEQIGEDCEQARDALGDIR